MHIGPEPYRPSRALGRACTGVFVARPPHLRRNAYPHRPDCFHLQPPAPIRAGFMFTESPSTWRGELAATLRIAAPLALANLLQMLVYAIDVIFVARLGEQQLAASSLSIALFGLMMWCFSGPNGMGGALIGAEHRHRPH